MSARNVIARVRGAIEELHADAAEHVEKSLASDAEPSTYEQQVWCNEGYRRGVLCAVADIEAVLPKSKHLDVMAPKLAKPRRLKPETFEVTDVDGDSILVYKTERGTAIGGCRKGEVDGFSVVLDARQLDRVLTKLISIRQGLS